MKRILTIFFAAIVAVGCLQAKEKVSVLYVGGTPDINTYGVPADPAAVAKSAKERTADFNRFLKQHFTKVKVVDAADYTPDMSDAYDVTLFDGKPREIKPHALLPFDFDRAAICIAEMSEELGRSIGTKNDWFCLCLDNYALGWKKDHPIFNGPFKVNITTEMRPTPEVAKEYGPIYGYTLPDQTEMWMVHEPFSLQSGKRIGMVSRPWGYTDSPDAEVISGGQCVKSIDAVAIGRHGNFLHWGFAAKPSDMTESARAALANAIVYMKDYNGKRIIARKLNEGMATRDNAVAAKYYASRACNDSQYEMELNFYNATDSIIKVVKAKQQAGEELQPMELMYLQMPEPQKPVRRPFEDYIRNREPKLFHIFGEDEDEYARYYDRNAPYMYPTIDGYALDIDEDVRAMGIANNDIRLLDKAIELLGKGGSDAERGRRVLERYTLCRFATPGEWQVWLDRNRDRMFFTESGGWLWLVNTDDHAEPGNDYTVLERKENETPAAPDAPAGVTDNNNPVALNAGLSDAPDGCKDVVLTMTVHDGYHTYAYVDENDPFIPTEVTIELPEGYEKVGDLRLPSPSPSPTATTYYTGTGSFTQRIKGQGAGKAIVTVKYQVCDNSICFPPATKSFEVDL
ncbi:MAG: protein-disulfide reductase DsbD N-terminal domain-containing protein [Duncaniella sp.]|uniref:protein-disulfide reductase DsbD domain-containing protein n=1 Tax=Duncaniella sp. TaxID=2518496 RepID=UPI0023D0EAE4|nr:protein-disulfide reductase DsbD domain-containing protein [Duncaniella sp.]MDE5988666.1 protein-disulfide reductase DsbD N-terminal domain-containing protein [Duncaniella sp.]